MGQTDAADMLGRFSQPEQQIGGKNLCGPGCPFLFGLRNQGALAWIIHDFSGEKRKDALKG